MTISILWWHIPTILTILSFIYILFIFKDDGQNYGLDTILVLIPTLIINLIVWIIGGILK